MEINEYLLQEREQCWNSNKYNRLLESKSTLGEWKKLDKKKTKRRKHLVLTSYRSYKDSTFLLIWSQTATNVSYQTKYIVKHILVECTDQVHIRETFYSANDMNELFHDIGIKNVMSFLKVINISGKIQKFQQD